MELLVASAIGILTASGLYLVLRLRSFPVIMGTSLLTYAVNVFLFASGRLTVGAPPLEPSTAGSSGQALESAEWPVALLLPCTSPAPASAGIARASRTRKAPLKIDRKRKASIGPRCLVK